MKPTQFKSNANIFQTDLSRESELVTGSDSDSDPLCTHLLRIQPSLSPLLDSSDLTFISVRALI